MARPKPLPKKYAKHLSADAQVIVSGLHAAFMDRARVWIDEDPPVAGAADDISNGARQVFMAVAMAARIGQSTLEPVAIRDWCCNLHYSYPMWFEDMRAAVREVPDDLETLFPEGLPGHRYHNDFGVSRRIRGGLEAALEMAFVLIFTLDSSQVDARNVPRKKR